MLYFSTSIAECMLKCFPRHQFSFTHWFIFTKDLSHLSYRIHSSHKTIHPLCLFSSIPFVVERWQPGANPKTDDKGNPFICFLCFRAWFYRFAFTVMLFCVWLWLLFPFSHSCTWDMKFSTNEIIHPASRCHNAAFVEAKTIIETPVRSQLLI